MAVREIFNNSYYNASVINRNGNHVLIVSSNRRQFGYMLDGAEGKKWTREIETAIDANEAHALCRAILNS